MAIQFYHEFVKLGFKGGDVGVGVALLERKDLADKGEDWVQVRVIHWLILAQRHQIHRKYDPILQCSVPAKLYRGCSLL